MFEELISPDLDENSYFEKFKVNILRVLMQNKNRKILSKIDGENLYSEDMLKMFMDLTDKNRCLVN